jgi:GT2 family glycosyltransferase
MSHHANAVTVVVVTWQGRRLLGPCLDSLRRQSMRHRLVVVDNASTDGTLDLLASGYPEAQVIALPHNTGFAGGVAAALPHVDSRFVALLNNDAEAEASWLAEATSCLESQDLVAAVSSRMLLPGEPARINNTGVVLRRDGYGADRGLGDLDGSPYDEGAEVFGASGGAGVYRTLAVKAVGGVDPRYFMYYEDTDLSWRLRLAGWRIQYCPAAVVRHRHAASSEPGSATFAFHTERNRLLTLLRCAPWPFAALRVCRFVGTTASLGLKRALNRALPASAVFSPVVRLKALASALRLGPSMVGVRSFSSRRDRGRVLREWRGVDQRPVQARPSILS